MAYSPVHNDQRKANQDAHEQRMAQFEKAEAAAKARREAAQQPAPRVEKVSNKRAPIHVPSTDD